MGKRAPALDRRSQGYFGEGGRDAPTIANIVHNNKQNFMIYRRRSGKKS